ncbi:MAG: nuclear transport factor 2 family protein [Acidimicrobiales bacterium]
MSVDHVSTVTSIYEAFGRGDVATILGHLADDVRWDHGMRRMDVPYLREVTGHAAVAGFFGALAEQLEVTRFEISSIVGSDHEVFTRVHLAGRNRHTGLDVPEAPEAHHFVFGDDGKVVAFTHIGDWAVHEAAMPGGRPLEVDHATA